MPAEITCRRVAVAEILPLRHRILRPGLPAETARFEGDDAPGTRHYAAAASNGPLACLTLMPSAWKGRSAWQLRGMATDAAVQGRGLGRTLLEVAVAEARCDEPERIFWCNARMTAVGFYERLGWRVVSETFEVPTAGPHVKMVRDAEGVGGSTNTQDRLQACPHGGAHGGAHGDAHGVGAGDDTREPTRPPVAGFIAVELAFLAAAHLLGGPPWVAVGVVAMIGQVAADFRLRPLVGLAPAVGWMVAHQLTGNRELFFPYAMALAAHLAGQFGGRGRTAAAVAGGLVVAAFMGIRVIQDATARVLAVELAVAVAILAAVVAAVPLMARRSWRAVAVAAAASLAAYAGLAL